MPGSVMLLLDAFGTLLFPALPIPAIYREAAQKAGLPISEQEIRQRFGPAFQRWFRPWRSTVLTVEQENQWRNDWQTQPVETIARWSGSAINPALQVAGHAQQDSEQDRWHHLVAEVLQIPNERPDLRDSVFETLWNRFEDPTVWLPCPTAEAFFARVQQQNWQVAVASNFDRRLYTILEKVYPDLDRDQVFISSELGVSKPSPDFYRKIQSVRQADHWVMIGDSWCEDVIVPASLGFTSFWIQTGSEWKTHPSVIPDLGSVVGRLDFRS